MPTSGRAGWRPRASTFRPRADLARGCGSSSSSHGCSGRARSPTWCAPSRATRRSCTRPRASPEVASIAADEHEHAEIWKRLETDGLGGVSGNGARRALPPAPARRSLLASSIPGRRPGARRGTGAASRGRSGQPSSASATGWSATSRWSWASPAQRSRTRASSCSPDSPASSPARSAWRRASTCRCSRSASCSSARSRSSAPSSRRRPRRRPRSWLGIYRAKGFTDAEAARIARRLVADPETALDTLVREELGLDPDQLGSPWGAAIGSFLAFAAGALVPVLPYLVGSRRARLPAQPRSQPPGAVRGRRRREPLDRSRHPVRWHAPGADRAGGGRRDVRRRTRDRGCRRMSSRRAAIVVRPRTPAETALPAGT